MYASLYLTLFQPSYPAVFGESVDLLFHRNRKPPPPKNANFIQKSRRSHRRKKCELSRAAPDLAGLLPLEVLLRIVVSLEKYVQSQSSLISKP